MARLLPPDPATLSDAQKQVAATIAAGPRGQVRGPLAIWLHRPELAERAQALGAYCRYGSSLDPRLSELAILTMARLWMAEYEWWAHKPPAQKAGLAPQIIDALRTGTVPEFGADDAARLTYELTVELTEKRGLSQQSHDRALDILGPERLVDLVGLCGYYTLISMTINAFQLALPDGAQPELSAS
jgi:4-carboxymuconolactone decarboxylase